MNLLFMMLLLVMGIPQYVDAADPILPFDTQVTGTISSTDYQDIYKITVPEAGTITANVKAYISPVRISYQDSNNQDVGYSNWIYNGRPENPTSWSGSMNLEAGVYYLFVAGSKDSEAGDYHLNVNFKPANNNETEPNQSMAEAMPLTLNGKSVKGFLNWIDTQDFYKIDLTQPGRLWMNVNSDLNSGVVTFYDGKGKEIYWDHLGYKKEFTIEWKRHLDLDAGTYYFSVVGNDSYQGLYEVSAAFTAAAVNDAEPNNDPASAERIQFGKTYAGFNGYGNPQDYYKFETKNDGVMIMESSSEFMSYELKKEGEDHIIYDLFGNGGSIGNPVSTTRKVKLSKGTYYLKVWGGGDYTFSVRPESTFLDVSGIYSPAVTYLFNNEVTSGLSKTEFGTTQQIKRVDAAIWLAAILKLDTSNETAPAFTDVPKRGWGAVNALKEAGIVSGKSPTYFGANDNVTRGEMALMLQKAYKLSADGVEMRFIDVTSRYDLAVRSLIKNNITNGKSATTFGTNLSITRGEMAVFLYRADSIK